MTITFRQSPIILLSRLFVLEVILIALYLLVRLPKSFLLSPLLNANEQYFINLVGVVYYAFITLIELILVAQLTLSWANEQYEIRDGSVIHRKGVLKLEEDEFTLRNISSASIRQSLFGRLFNYGTIHVYSPLLKQDFLLNNVHNPKEVITHLQDDLSGKDNSAVFRRRG